MITIGILIMAFVNLGVQDESWGWRLSIGVQIVPAVTILLSSLLVLPESPRYLLKVGRDDKARIALLTLAKGAPCVEQVVSKEIDEILEEVQEEAAESSSASAFELLKGSAFPAFLCGFFIALCQNVTGVNWFMNYATILFNNLGFDAFLFDTILK